MINPDHLGYVCLTTDGKTQTGTLLEHTEARVVLGTMQGDKIVIPTSEIDQLKLSRQSAMPGDYATRLTQAELMDIVAYLITKPMEPAPFERADLPPPRTMQEWETFHQTTAPSREICARM